MPLTLPTGTTTVEAPNFLAGNKVPLAVAPFNPVYASLQPRTLVNIDGNDYIPLRWAITKYAHGATDEATVHLPIDGSASTGIAFYPDWTTTIQRSDELGNANAPVVVKIYAGFPSNPNGSVTVDQLSLRFAGVVDHYEVDLAGNLTTFTCRSLASPLTSTKITTPFAGQSAMTTQTFIKQACAHFGLGTFFNPKNPAYGTMQDVLGSEFVTGVHGWYIWDLILQCAQYDDVDVWVDANGVLHYEAAQFVNRQLVQYTWLENIDTLVGSHSPQFSKNIEVQVHSWVKKQRITSGVKVATGPDGNGVVISQYTRNVTSTPIFGTTETVTTSISNTGIVTVGTSTSTGGSANASTGFSTAGGDSGKQKYVYFIKGKTLAQCAQIAQNIWRQISMLEFAIKLTAPVTPAELSTVDVTSSLIVFNSPMARFNNEYWPRQIDESFDPEGGWTYSIDAVNHELAAGAV